MTDRYINPSNGVNSSAAESGAIVSYVRAEINKVISVTVGA